MQWMDSLTSVLPRFNLKSPRTPGRAQTSSSIGISANPPEVISDERLPDGLWLQMPTGDPDSEPIDIIRNKERSTVSLPFVPRRRDRTMRANLGLFAISPASFDDV